MKVEQYARCWLLIEDIIHTIGKIRQEALDETDEKIIWEITDKIFNETDKLRDYIEKSYYDANKL